MSTRSLLAVALACCLAPFAATTPALADEGGPVGYSAGADPVLWQYTSAVHFRGNPWGSYSESIISLLTRSQTLSADKSFAIDTFGLGASLGVNAWQFRLGLSAELDWYKKLQLKSGAANELEFVNGVGYLVEPYVAVPLPFLQTPFTSTEVSLHWPVLSSIPAVGPRVMATIWIGPGPLEDMEATPEEEIPEDMEDMPEQMDDSDMPEMPEEEAPEEMPAPEPSQAPAPQKK